MAKVAIIGLSGESIFLNLEEFPQASVTTHAKGSHVEPGGKGYNQAVACKMFGVDVSYLSKVGNDYYGKYCEEYLVNRNINCFFIKDDEPTALATILTDKKGENEVIVAPGASKNLNITDLKVFEKEIKEADVLLLQYEVPIDVIYEAIFLAKTSQTIVILNPAPAIYQDKKLLEMADIVTPNFEEAKLLYDLPKNIQIEKLGEYLKDKINNQLIVTLGKNGSLYVANGNYKYYQPRVVDAVDTTGAGDIFNAGIVSMLAKRKKINEAIQFATIASSISVTRRFVMDAIPTLNEIEKIDEDNDN